jgi:8-oxo-dGTP pyrophosphatase MutT (NUDIX family)
MYQVFINEHRIHFAEKWERNQQNEGTLCVKDSAEAEFRPVVEWLMSEQKPMVVYFSSANPAADWKTFQSLFIYIAAAGGLVQNDQGQLLFIKRLGKWDLPKGKVEKGEDIKTAAIREVEEECGIGNLKISKSLPSTFHMYELKGEVVFKETFWFAMQTDFQKELTPQTEEDITEVCWVDPQQMEEQLKNTYPSIRELLEGSGVK